MRVFLTEKLDMDKSITAESIIEYWYSDSVKSKWFNSTIEFDKALKEKYEETWKEALRGEYISWSESAEGCLALVIILDQFPLNMFRGELQSFSSEAVAVKISKKAIERGFDKEIDNKKLSFLYMPLMHSENLDDQNLAVKLFEQANLMENARFAKHHREIIEKFGRFPHRNKILQRESSKAEIDYLNSEGAFTG